MNTKLLPLILKALSLGIGVAVFVLSIMKKLDINEGVNLLALALTSLTLSLLNTENTKEDINIDNPKEDTK